MRPPDEPMKRMECLHGPLDGLLLFVPLDTRRVFYAPARSENSTYATYARGPAGDEDSVPAWDRQRLSGNYYLSATGPSDALQWKPN